MKSERHPYYPIFPWIRDKLSWRKSALVRFGILRLFVNQLTAYDKYSHPNMQNFQQQIQTQLSEKDKTFSEFFIAFKKCALNFEYFEKKRWVS